MLDTIVVGAGLFGRVITAELRSRGQRVILMDDRRAMAGSTPAACLMKPSWISTMSNRDYDAAIGLLDRHYRVEQVDLEVIGKKAIRLDWVPPRRILGDPLITLGKVTGLSGEAVLFAPADGFEHQRWEAKNVIIATGAWAGELIPEVRDRVTAKGGYAFTMKGQLDRQFMKIWAPYRQIVAFNRSPEEVWVNDGTALKPDSMNAQKEAQSRDRCAGALSELEGAPMKTVMGYRPYFIGPKAPALVERVRPGLWVATGGAKNGTLGAAWAAQRIAEQIA